MLIVAFLMIISNLNLVLSDDKYDVRRHCREYSPERNVNIDEIKGHWFVAQIIFHNRTDETRFNLMSRFNQIVLLKPDRSHHRNDDLRITLYENNNLSNHIKGRISDNKNGYLWALITNREYALEEEDIKYNAVIQILRKTDRYMVWHFCTNPLFSIFMIRNYDVPPPPALYKEFQDLIRSKNLEIESIQEVDRPTRIVDYWNDPNNSANMITFVLYFHIILIFLGRLFH